MNSEIIADSFFTIGSRHEVCQDYCLDINNRTVALSDGCSSNSHSDFGSRILVNLGIQNYASGSREPL